MTDAASQREVILTALERLLAWPEISRSPQLGRFLGYIVRRTLEGDEQSIKAYSIAVDVFGRAPDFDPQADPIVRVQARRLRGLLDDYYRGPGVGEVMQIHLPVGRYVPEFAAAPDPGQVASPPESPPPPPPQGWLPGSWTFAASWFALALATVGLAVAFYAINSWQRESGQAAVMGVVQRPTITIVEFQNLAKSAAAPPQVAGLAIELVTDLEQFGNIGVRYGGGGESNVAVADLPLSDYVLTGIVRPDGNVVQYSAILTDNRTSTVVWNQTLTIPAAQAGDFQVLDRVSKSLSLVLGSPRGPLHEAARQFLSTSVPDANQVNLYLCRVLFDLYRETSGAREAERARTCIESLPEAERGTATALAVAATLATVSADRADDPQAKFRLAAANLEEAIGLEPINAFVWEQQARLHEAQGEAALALAAFQSSVQLNPASVDALAAYALLLAFDGRLTEAEPLSIDAADGSPSPPPWYQGVPALLALRDGDYAKAVSAAELYARADRELGPILAIMAAQRDGDTAIVNRYLPQVLDMATFRARGVMPQLRTRITDQVLLDTIRATLIAAGVPPAAMIRSF